MPHGSFHPQRRPLTEQKGYITVAKKKSDPFDYLQWALLKLFFINGLEEEDQWVVLYVLLSSPLPTEPPVQCEFFSSSRWSVLCCISLNFKNMT